MWLPAVGDARPWTGAPGEVSSDLTFALMSDRTGLARPGVFEQAVEVVNRLHPDFVIQIGDTIEGYSSDATVLAAQWKEFDEILGALERPLFRVVGNHDVSNDVMRDAWVRRHGPLYYHFRHADVLFLVLDTSDPPQRGGEVAGDLTLDRLAELHALRDADPEAVRREFEALADWESTMPADISDEQVSYFEQALAQNTDVRWTFVCMHIPAWQGDGHPALDRIHAALGDRPYTFFAGHIHNYQRRVLHGRDHIRLGPTGGAWVLDGDEGNFDHITLVRMTRSGPRIANLLLGGVLGIDGGAPPPALSTFRSKGHP